MDRGLEKLLADGAERLGVRLDSRALGRFGRYLEELAAWNRRMNLTTVDEARDVVVRHFLDSLTPVGVIDGLVEAGGVGGAATELLDIGAGAGFPGLPIKIARPGLRVVLVDSVAKKVHFMRHVIRTLDLDGAEAVHARVEDRALAERFAASFGCVTSRAFADTAAFVAAARPYAAPGGLIVAMKGPRAAEELYRAEGAGALDGVVHVETRVVEVPFSGGRSTTLVVFRKGEKDRGRG